MHGQPAENQYIPNKAFKFNVYCFVQDNHRTHSTIIENTVRSRNTNNIITGHTSQPKILNHTTEFMIIKDDHRLFKPISCHTKLLLVTQNCNRAHKTNSSHIRISTVTQRDR